MNKEQLEKTIKILREMRLPAMADELVLLIESNEITTLQIEEILERISESERFSRKNHTIMKLKKKAKLSQANASLNDIDYKPERKINKKVLEQLSSNDYIVKHRNVVVLGACGTGKSYICNALGNHACESGYSVLYCRLFEYISEANLEKLTYGEAIRTINKYTKPEVLIIDDFLIHEINDQEAALLFKIFEYRYGNKTTIICSQLEPKEWHKHLGGYILADSILDRILPNSYRLILSGNSLRQEQ